MAEPETPITLVIEAYDMPDAIRALIGDIGLIGGELDVLISLALFKLIDLDYATGFKIFGQSAISSRLENIRYFSYRQPDTSLIEKFAIIKSQMESFSDVRNTLAHGVYWGKSEKGLAFSVPSKVAEINETTFVYFLRSISEDHMQKTHKKGLEIASAIREVFGLRH